MSWWLWVLVGLAGAVGAPLRYVIASAVTHRFGATLPFGTLVINISGSFVLGLLSGLAIYAGLPGAPKLVVGTGLVGVYTTFSTFSYETVALLEEGAARPAAWNVILSVVIGGVAAGAGIALAAL